LALISAMPSEADVRRKYIAKPCSPWLPCGWTGIRLIKLVSLQILVAQVVLIENPLDDIASPLGISINMLIKAAITRNPFLPNIGGSEHARAMKWCLYPGFQGEGIIRDHSRGAQMIAS